MSWRTDVIRSVGFDEVLGSRVGYATHEDNAACSDVFAPGKLIAAAHAARVYHNMDPAPRAGGRAYGFFHSFNYAYTVASAMVDESVRSRMKPHLRYKLALHAARFTTSYHREVFGGAVTAFGHIDRLLATPPEELAALYADLSQEFARP